MTKVNLFELCGIDSIYTVPIFSVLFIVSIMAILSIWLGGKNIGSYTIPEKNKKVIIIGCVLFLIAIFSILPLWSRNNVDMPKYEIRISDNSLIDALKKVKKYDSYYHIKIDTSLYSIKTRKVNLSTYGTTEEILKFICDEAELNTEIICEKNGRNITIKAKDE